MVGEIIWIVKKCGVKDSYILLELLKSKILIGKNELTSQTFLLHRKEYTKTIN